MTTYQQLKQKTLHLFQQAQAIAQSQGEDEIDNNLAEAKKRFTAEKLFVVVCGEFKQGKSNLLNAFLNETELFPGETHLNFIDKTPFLCIKEGICIYRLIDFIRVIVMV